MNKLVLLTFKQGVKALKLAAVTFNQLDVLQPLFLLTLRSQVNIKALVVPQISVTRSLTHMCLESFLRSFCVPLSNVYLPIYHLSIYSSLFQKSLQKNLKGKKILKERLNSACVSLAFLAIFVFAYSPITFCKIKNVFILRSTY